MAPKYGSTISLEGDCLNISVTYEQRTTKEEEESLRDFYQHRFSQRVGRPVSRQDIKVKPCEGDIKESMTFFRVKQGKILYIGLPGIHQKAPYALPRLVEDLKMYGAEHDLQDKEDQLIQTAIDGLTEIIESSGYNVLACIWHVSVSSCPGNM